MRKEWLTGGIGLLALTLLMVPVPKNVEAASGQVHVVIENTTYPVAEGAPWEGVLVDSWVDLNAESTMMTCVADALGDIPSEGTNSSYISSIKDLAEFDGNVTGKYEGSGWMGTLNDWFVSEGFDEWKVSEGELLAGDEIHVMYTRNYGEDIGGLWNASDESSPDKHLKDLQFSVGTLTPAFASDTTEYQLEIPEETAQLLVTPTAVNKNFQVRTFKGETWYRRTAAIPVADGDVLQVKVGDPSWNSMNGSDTEAMTYRIQIQTKAQEPEPEPEPEPERPENPVLSSLKATAKGVTFSWKAVEGVDRYRVYRKIDGGSWVKLKDQTGLTYNDTDVKSGTTYTYTVRCRRDGLWSEYEKADKKTIIWLAQPALKLANTAKGVTINWAKIPGATGYIVYRRVGSGKWVNLGTVKTLNFTDTKAASGTTYNYTVKAAKGKTYSTYDTTKKILYLAQPRVKVAKVSGGIKVSWGKIGGVKNYIVYRKTGAKGSWTRLATVTGTSYTDKKAKTKTTYYYTVKAANGKTYSSYTASSAVKR